MTSECCISGYQWDGKPEGKETKLASNDTYVVGSEKDVAILLIYDIYGWTLPDLRLLADHFVREVGAVVYLPDFFAGEVVTPDTFESEEKRKAFNLPGFIKRHNKELRGPEIFACANSLKADQGFKKLGTIGYCYGGWAVFQLGSKENNLVDVTSTAHPFLLTREEIDAVAVPVQIIAPEHDPALTLELKAYANTTIIPSLGVPYDYQYFPGVAHGFAARCNLESGSEKKALERAKNAAVGWFRQFLKLA